MLIRSNAAAPNLLWPCPQVELADVIVMNKTDLAEPQELSQLERMLRALNPGAQVIRVRGPFVRYR